MRRITELVLLRRWAPILAGTCMVATTLMLALPAGASSAASSLPTLNVALNGTRGVSVSGSMVSGAVNVVSTFHGRAPAGPNSNGPGFGLVRLNPGVSFQQAAGVVQSHRGDLNALTRYATLLADAGAPSSIQTVLTPGNYVAINITGNGQPAAAQFTVSQSSSPAALPRASATETAIEFGFRGPTKLRNGTIVRARNGGWLVHMVTLTGARSRAAGVRLMQLLRQNASRRAARPYLTNVFVTLLGPASPGGMQQTVLHARPGYYVESCFMDTQDGRQHTQLGMERLVRVVK